MSGPLRLACGSGGGGRNGGIFQSAAAWMASDSATAIRMGSCLRYRKTFIEISEAL
jgi:hypothetical protein